MTGAAPLAIGWRLREPPLDPVAVVAFDDAVGPLLRATEVRLAVGTTLRVAYAPGRLLVLGAAADLPWAEGVTYLGDDDGLLVPTALATVLPPALVRAAFARRAPAAHLFALVGDHVVSTVRPARPADFGSLRLAVQQAP